jgi:hypothetical protein
MNELFNRQCNSDPEFSPKSGSRECEELMVAIDKEWDLNFPVATLSRKFKLKNYYQEIAYTNSGNGLSINNFICAARIDALM